MPIIEIPKDRTLLPLARELRSHMTRHEKKLWYDFLSHYFLSFRRQQIIERYIVDFFCEKIRLVIELDGNQHYEPAMHRADLSRTNDISKYGIQVVRYDNRQIDRNFRGVCEDIDRVARERLKMMGSVLAER